MRWLSVLEQELVAWYAERKLEKKGIFLRNFRGERVLNEKILPDDMLAGTIEAVLASMLPAERDNHLLVQELVLKVFKMQGWKEPKEEALRRLRQRIQNSWGKFPVSEEEKARRAGIASWVANKSEPKTTKEMKEKSSVVAKSLTDF